MNKKGFVDFTARKTASLVLGLIILALGLLPLLQQFNVISFGLPEGNWFFFLLWIVAMVGSVVLIIDAFHEIQEFGGFHKAIMAASFIVAILLFVYGLDYFIALPFPVPAVGQIIINIVLAIAGILLVIGAFLGL